MKVDVIKCLFFMRVMIVWCILNVDIKLPNIACMVYHNYLSLPLGWAICSATSTRCCLGSLVVFVLQMTLKALLSQEKNGNEL